MMVFDLFLKGLLTGFLVSLPVGPLGILVIQRTANRNFKSGFYSGLRFLKWYWDNDMNNSPETEEDIVAYYMDGVDISNLLRTKPSKLSK